MTAEKGNVSPLAALAESIATPKEVRKKLTQIAESQAIECLCDDTSISQARNLIREKLLGWTKKHYFAKYGRKKMIDKVVSKTMKRYKHVYYELPRAMAGHVKYCKPLDHQDWCYCWTEGVRLALATKLMSQSD